MCFYPEEHILYLWIFCNFIPHAQWKIHFWECCSGESLSLLIVWRYVLRTSSFQLPLPSWLTPGSTSRADLRASVKILLLLWVIDIARITFEKKMHVAESTLNTYIPFTGCIFLLFSLFFDQDVPNVNNNKLNKNFSILPSDSVFRSYCQYNVISQHHFSGQLS